MRKKVTHHHRFMDDILEFRKCPILTLIFKNPTYGVTHKRIVNFNPIEVLRRTKHPRGKGSQPEMFLVKSMTVN